MYKLLFILTGCLLLFSVVSLYFPVVPHDWLRFFTSGILFMMTLKVFTLKNIMGPAIFLLLFFCDLFLLLWDGFRLKSGYYLSHISAMGILTILTLRELKWPAVSTMEMLSIPFFFIINSVILVYLGHYFNSGIENIWLRIIFYVNGLFIITVVLAAFLYSIHFANKVSAFLFLGIMALTISDLLLFGIYFIDLLEFIYIDNILYILGLSLLIYSYLEHKKLLRTRTEFFKKDKTLRKEEEATSSVYR